MKKIISLLILLGGVYLYAGNGHEGPPCNCNLPDQVNIFAAGYATLEGGTQVKCTGEAGTCWEVTFKPGGGWVLTIYVEPPISFGNSNSQDNPPQAPYEEERGDTFVIYEWNENVWKQK